MKDFYQNIPSLIDPVALRIGSFSIGWYPIMYIVGFAVVFFLLRFRKRETAWKEIIQNSKFKIKNYNPKFENELILDFLIYSFLGLLIGARLGYVFFYNLSYYSAHTLEAFLPIQDLGFGFQVTGFYGMSYHGGLIGVILAAWYFTKKNKIDFLQWANFVAPAVPAGFFFGRIGNFLNGELYGRATSKAWGMYFPSGGGLLRHPSQLYEALLEGLILFIILWALRNGIRHKGKISNVSCFMSYIFLYGLFRFFLEFFREPDSQLGLVVRWGQNGLTMGQILSLGMIILLIALLLFKKDEKVV